MKAKVVIGFLLAFFAIFAVACSGDDDDNNGSQSGSALEIGALLPLTGSLSSYGETSNAALEAAVVELNSKGGTRINLRVEDTKTDPPTALEKLRSLSDRGIKVVIGPYSSSEAGHVKDFANANGIILISPLSTARTLAIADDNLLRFTPDDEQEGVAVAALAWADGVRVIQPVTRDDPGNQGLQSAMKASFEKLGGRFLAPVVYGTGEQDFTKQASDIQAGISGAGVPAGEVAVYLTAFDEVTKLFAKTSAMSSLKDVAWYGSDSVALSKGLQEDRTAAAFAAATGYPNPILGLPESQRSMWGPVSETLARKLGRAPDAFAFAAYDALSVIKIALPGGVDGDAATLRQRIVQAAAGYTGFTGATTLNPAGDRALGNYDFWSICDKAGVYSWERTFTYVAANGGRVAAATAC